MSDVKATFDHIQSRFNEGMDLGDFSAIYTFELGEEGGSWTIRIEGGKGQSDGRFGRRRNLQSASLR